MYRKIVTLMAILWSAAPVWAQFTIIGADTPIFNPEELIREVCLGEGIEVLDVEFNGVSAAVGRFSGGQDYIGLDEGFLMTTGFASSLSGQGYGADETAPFIANVPNGSTAGYPGLESLANNEEIRDVAMYTIRFVPAGDSIMFRYVFASEEYPLFVCSRFNDVFGFFLTKSVGDADPETVNIATVPGTELPVSINSVNGGEPGTHFSVDISYCDEPAGSLDNAAFFNSNSGQSQPVYDGFTDVFVAKAAVEPCQPYTMTLVLADIGDVLWDSGLFFEAKSFCSFTGGEHESEEVAVVEGCGASTLAIGLEAFPANDYPLSYSISGTATAGEDYSLGLSASGEITEPSAQWLVELMVPDDGEGEEVETIEINISGQICSEKTYIIKLFDPLQIEGPASALCSTEPITLNVVGEQEALETFNFSWSTGQVGPAIEVNPTETTAYILEYGDALNTCTREFTIVLENPQSTLDLELCTNEEGVVVNGTLYDFFNPAGLEVIEGGSAAGCDSTVTINLTPKVSETLNTGLCPGESLIVNGEAYGQERLSGMEVISGGAADGCDSVVYVDLFLLEADTTEFRATLCEEETIEINGTFYGIGNPGGVEVLENAAVNGCDSVVMINLDFYPRRESRVEAAIEEGQAYTIGGQSLAANGEHRLSFTDQNGCDSIVTVNLAVTPVTSTLTDSIAIGMTARQCLNTALFQSVASVTNLCENPGSGTTFEIEESTACLDYTGTEAGVDTACLLACDGLGLCDTTYLIVSVFTNLLDAVDDRDTTVFNETKIVPVLANDWISSTVLTDQYIVEPPQYGAAAVNGNGTITYDPNLTACLQEDEFSYAICNEIGCDTATVAIWLADATGICDGVWPGDVNNDGIVNQIDHWAIGLAYGRNGPVRPNASNNWEAQPMIDWNGTTTFIYEFNLKYTDCNGNGAINSDDVYAIYLNWGRTHPLAPVRYDFPNRPLARSLEQRKVEGQEQELAFSLGSENQPLADAYGLAFEVYFNPAMAGGFHFDAAGGWLGAEGEDMMVLQKVDAEAGIAYLSLVRTDRTGRTAFGEIGRFKLQCPSGDCGRLAVRNIQLLQSDAQAFDIGEELIYEAGALTGTHDALGRQISVFPNPAHEMLNISLPSSGQATLFSMDGKLHWAGHLQQGANRLSVNGLNTGIYVLQVQLPEGAVSKRVAIISALD